MYMKIFLTSILLLGFLFNTYKIELAGNPNYPIFPWQSNPNIAKTPSYILQPHVITALALLFLSYLRCLQEKSPSWLQYTHLVVHLLFCMEIVTVLTNFGSAPWYVALLINGGIWVTLNYLLIRKLPPKLYFLILAGPIYYEVIVYTISIIL